MWRDQAACFGDDPEEWAEETPHALAVCGGCPVRTECLTDALRPPSEGGVGANGGMRGGLTEDAREKLLRSRARRRARDRARDMVGVGS